MGAPAADLSPDEERQLQKFTRRENPQQRRARIAKIKVDKDRAAVIKKAFGISEAPMADLDDRQPRTPSTDSPMMHKVKA